MLALPSPQISKYHSILTVDEPTTAGQRLQSLPVHLDGEQSQCLSFERVETLDSVSVHVALTPLLGVKRSRLRGKEEVHSMRPKLRA